MSASIVILDDPAGINAKKRYSVPDGINLLDWLIDEYGRSGFSVPTIIYKNGLDDANIVLKACGNETEVYIGGGFSDSGMVLCDGDQITIIHSPLGGVAFAVAAFVISIIAVALVDVPEIPEFNTPQESPNNQLTGQTNIARPLQRIPDLYGVNRIYPDLIAQSYFEFVNNIKFLTEFMCIGRGEHLIEDIRSGDTLITDISGATAQVFEPFTIPSELLNVTDSNEANGQEIIAPNGSSIFAAATDVEYTANNKFESESSSFLSFGDLSPGDNIGITGVGYSSVSATGKTASFQIGGNVVGINNFNPNNFLVGDYITISNSTNDGIYIISAVNAVITTDQVSCLDPVTMLPVSFIGPGGPESIDYTTVFPNNGNFTFSTLVTTPGSPDIHEVTVTETSFGLLDGANNNFSSTSDSISILGPFNVPGNPDEVWFDVNFPRGIVDGTSPYTVQFNFKLQQVDGGGAPIGSVEDNFKAYTGFNSDPLNFTFKAIPLVPDALYTATIERLTDTLSATDESKWTRLAGVENVTVSDFGNVTTMLVNTQATEQATSVQERKTNCRATRKLVTYDGGAVTITPEPTAKFADALLNQLTDPFMGNKPASQIDLDEIYAIQDEIDTNPIYGDSLGRFCYSFSSQRTPVGDELKTTANAARGVVTRRGDIVSFTRDSAQNNPVSVFNKRNKKPDSERKSISFNKPSDFDGTELQWVEEETGEAFTVFFPEDLTGSNLKRIEAAGIKNYDQAWNRANYEFLKLQYQRTSTETVVTKEGLLLSLNNLINSVDGTNVKSQDGEITAIAGLIVTTTERVNFNGGSATVLLRAENGDSSLPIVVTPRSDTESGYVLSALPSFDIIIRGENFNQKGTLYNFFPDNNHLATGHLVQSISPGDDGYVDLKLINYAPEIYAPDEETPTPQGV